MPAFIQTAEKIRIIKYEMYNLEKQGKESDSATLQIKQFKNLTQNDCRLSPQRKRKSEAEVNPLL